MKHQLSSRRPDFSQWKMLRQVLRSCKAVATFMVHRGQSSPYSEMCEATYSYQTKAKFYPYLPVDEEQRDWLEHLYQQS